MLMVLPDQLVLLGQLVLRANVVLGVTMVVLAQPEPRALPDLEV